MKNIVLNRARQLLMIVAIFFSLLLFGGIQPAPAHDDDHGDQNGFHDSHGNYHRYGYHHHHRGYWNEDNGPRIWINI